MCHLQIRCRRGRFLQAPTGIRQQTLVKFLICTTQPDGGGFSRSHARIPNSAQRGLLSKPVAASEWFRCRTTAVRYSLPASPCRYSRPRAHPLLLVAPIYAWRPQLQHATSDRRPLFAAVVTCRTGLTRGEPHWHSRARYVLSTKHSTTPGTSGERLAKHGSPPKGTLLSPRLRAHEPGGSRLVVTYSNFAGYRS